MTLELNKVPSVKQKLMARKLPEEVGDYLQKDADIVEKVKNEIIAWYTNLDLNNTVSKAKEKVELDKVSEEAKAFIGKLEDIE